MLVNKIYEDIYEIENFISDTEHSFILQIINSLNEKDWFCERDDYTTPEFWFGKSMFFDKAQTDIVESINQKLSNLFINSYGRPTITNISRYRQNDAMGRHRDNHTKDEDVYSAYGAVLYYNDEYLGGEIEYPEIGIKIKPKSKSLIIHGGDILHGTCPVIDDKVRYFSTIFVKEKSKMPVRLNHEIFGGK